MPTPRRCFALPPRSHRAQCRPGAPGLFWGSSVRTRTRRRLRSLPGGTPPSVPPEPGGRAVSDGGAGLRGHPAAPRTRRAGCAEGAIWVEQVRADGSRCNGPCGNFAAGMRPDAIPKLRAGCSSHPGGTKFSDTCRTALYVRSHGHSGVKVRSGSRPARGARSPAAGAADRLGELKAMRDRGLITEDEYQAKRRQILDGM
jgi:hypothetical protein